MSEEEQKNQEKKKDPILIEALKIQLPMSLNFILERGTEVVNLIFIGQMGTVAEIGGVSLGNVLIAMLIFTIVLSLNSYTTQMMSKAKQSNNPRLVKDYLNKARIFSICLCTLNSIILTVCKYFLVPLGIDAETAHYCQLYLLVQLPALFVIVFYELSRALVFAFKRPLLTSHIIPFTFAFHFLWNWIFVCKLEWGVVGTSVATNITYLLNFLGQWWVLNRYEDMRECHGLSDSSVWNGLTDYMKAGLKVIVVRSSDAWSMMIALLVGATFSSTASAAIGICSSI